MTIGTRIRNRRIELNLSQDELAKRLNYKSRSSINKIELDQRNLTQSKIKAIADALETTPSYIMGWGEVEERKQVKACELFEECYGSDTYKAVALFLKLDELDRAIVVERMNTLLENDKYSLKDELKNA